MWRRPAFCVFALSVVNSFSSVPVSAFLCPTRRSAPHPPTFLSEKISLGNEKGDLGLKHALLLSSFSDGLKPNPDAIDFLMRGLVSSMWREHQERAELAVEQSVIQSPCCGPDLDALSNMESLDIALADLKEGRVSWRQVLQRLSDESCTDDPLELRFLYIPTAMYAIRSDSANSPGKQRQRARADGKKRRNDIVQLLHDQLGDDQQVSIRVVTLDLDDSSIKQPEGFDEDTFACPKDGKEAFQSWKPHFVYVQGGNTFWLYHCIEKGEWGSDFIQACTGENAAVYCGTSAGAIIMGQNATTACWKRWDDPSVVPNRATYEDWNNAKGFGLAGKSSFFPHMDDSWKALVDEKKAQFSEEEVVYALRDSEVCCVSRGEVIKVLSSAPVSIP